MSYAPATLTALRNYLITQTHLSPISLGIVGDIAHAKRASYHNGWDRVIKYGRTCATDYTVCTPEDRATPRTAAAAAIDIGANASTFKLPALRKMSVWLVGQARNNVAGTRQMREIIYSPDGVQVLRWDRERGVHSLPRPGEADASHRFHTHISWYRNSEKLDKVGIFRRYFEPVNVEAYKAKITCAVMTYSSSNVELGEISGLTVGVAERIKMDGQWRYRILPGTPGGNKYKGRYLPANSCVTYTPT